jgi:hypothetical protein
LRRREEIEDMEEGAIETEIKKMEEALRKRDRLAGPRSQRSGLGSLPLTMAILCLVGGQVSAFTVYDCSNRSKLIESYSLLEPNACGFRQSRRSRDDGLRRDRAD